MDEELVLVSSLTGEDNCILIYGDDPNHIEWACARLGTCALGGCTAGTRNVWIKQSDMMRYLTLRLVS